VTTPNHAEIRRASAHADGARHELRRAWFLASNAAYDLGTEMEQIGITPKRLGELAAVCQAASYRLWQAAGDVIDAEMWERAAKAGRPRSFSRTFHEQTMGAAYRHQGKRLKEAEENVRLEDEQDHKDRRWKASRARTRKAS
jgi:hypothetical protein